MGEHVKTRTYTSSLRAQQAERTRGAILDAARSLFVTQGFRRTTVQQIADRAGVNIDTIYSAVGRKPALMRELVETSLSGQNEAVPAQQRPYVQQIREAATAGEKIDIYAEAIAEIQQRMAPIFLALRDAALSDESCRALWKEISERRARNMLEFAADLRVTRQLRADLDDQRVADVIWSMNAAEYWVLLVEERGWTPAEFRSWIADSWRRLLLAS
ncbi:TetR family transcriptional regulator [Aeromicrobium sp. Root236]|uniref:TetR/AcrR family transcriptional regulator n=1 Tax=Aeromicrobium sp. Root236 TaxID=1736498 RepID=UPI0007015F82|nr:TetR/AcrR family transcriptional regulator [Aeromicrobium sp. Root236]KRC63603.1 TetR family transcriptional regulator [Aeromicrobium sp. Root236]